MFPTPEKTKPVDPEHFAVAVQVAAAAYSYRMPMESPAKQGLTLEMPDGNVEEIILSDVPLNRAALAIRDHFAPDMEMAGCALMRWMALMKVRSSEKMQKWVRHAERDPESFEV